MTGDYQKEPSTHETSSIVALALILAACGGAAADTGDGVASLEGTTVTTTAADETADPEAAAIAFTECMRENGVEMEDPTVDADGNVIPGRPTELPEPEDGENGEGIVAQAGEVSEELEPPSRSAATCSRGPPSASPM